MQLEAFERGLTLAIGALFSVAAIGWLVGRDRRQDFSGLRRLELIWTIIPIVLILVLFIATYMPDGNG